MDDTNKDHPESYLEKEYSSVEVSDLIQAALDRKPILNHSWLETRLYEWLFDALPKYMNKADVVYMLSDLRSEFMQGFTHTTAENLHKVCSRCRLCDIPKHDVITPIWNLSDPDLMIVIDNPSMLKQYGSFLSGALKDSGFKSDRIMVTYLTRCEMSVKAIENQFIANCAPFLFSELNAVNPKLVLPMGPAVWGALSGDVINKISDVEGELRFIGLFPYIPTKSLGYYSYQADKGHNSRLAEILSSAHNFLYNSPEQEEMKELATIPDDPGEM